HPDHRHRRAARRARRVPMTLLATFLGVAAHLAAAVLLPPLLLGVIQRTRARVAGRRGAPLLQPGYDLLKLFRKDRVISRTTTSVFIAGPAVPVATATLAGVLGPFRERAPPLPLPGCLVSFWDLFRA